MIYTCTTKCVIIGFIDTVYVQIFEVHKFCIFHKLLAICENYAHQILEYRILQTHAFIIILLSFKMALYCYFKQHSDNKLPRQVSGHCYLTADCPTL